MYVIVCCRYPSLIPLQIVILGGLIRLILHCSQKPTESSRHKNLIASQPRWLSSGLGGNPVVVSEFFPPSNKHGDFTSRKRAKMNVGLRNMGILTWRGCSNKFFQQNTPKNQVNGYLVQDWRIFTNTEWRIWGYHSARMPGTSRVIKWYTRWRSARTALPQFWASDPFFLASPEIFASVGDMALCQKLVNECFTLKYGNKSWSIPIWRFPESWWYP